MSFLFNFGASAEQTSTSQPTETVVNASVTISDITNSETTNATANVSEYIAAVNSLLDAPTNAPSTSTSTDTPSTSTSTDTPSTGNSTSTKTTSCGCYLCKLLDKATPIPSDKIPITGNRAFDEAVAKLTDAKIMSLDNGVALIGGFMDIGSNPGYTIESKIPTMTEKVAIVRFTEEKSKKTIMNYSTLFNVNDILRNLQVAKSLMNFKAVDYLISAAAMKPSNELKLLHSVKINDLCLVATQSGSYFPGTLLPKTIEAQLIKYYGVDETWKKFIRFTSTNNCVDGWDVYTA